MNGHVEDFHSDSTSHEFRDKMVHDEMVKIDSSDPNSLRPSSRIEIRQMPADVSKQELDALLAAHGTVLKCHLISTAKETYVSAIYESTEQAQTACDKLHQSTFKESTLEVKLMSRPAKARPKKPGNKVPFTRSSTALPLRIMVPSEYVGAIIGRRGQTVRTITTKCKARVDVHGRENSGLPEKVISIFGQPENCSNACREILNVMLQEATTNNRGEIVLKMLTNDRFCGRIIGKEGKMIKKIREETGTKISVSNSPELAVMYPDRVITIRGGFTGVDSMVLAEAAISAKTAECVEHEMMASAPHGSMMRYNMAPAGRFFPGGPRPYDFGQNFYHAPMFGGAGVPQRRAFPSQGGHVTTEVLTVSVPSAAVGAIIGAGGVNIKQMIRESGAFITIEPKKDSDGAERFVSLKGSTDSCYRASFLLFEKMRSDGFAGNDDVRLKVSFAIPKSVVGRIIGRAGRNVREVQRVTGAIVKVPEQSQSAETPGDDVQVEVFGNFMATQAAHSRIRGLAVQTLQSPRVAVRRSAPPPESQQ